MKTQTTRINKMFFTSLLILSLGYPGTITFNSHTEVEDLTIETGNKVEVAAGFTVTVNGALSINGTGELEIATGSTVDVTGAAAIAGKLDMDGTARLMVGGALSFATADLECDDGSGVYLDGGAQTVSGTLQSGQFDNLICSGGTTTFDLTAEIEDSLITGGQNFIISDSKTLTMNDGSVMKVSGGDWTVTGTLTLHLNSKVLYDTGANATLTFPAVTYGDIEHNGGELTQSGALKVAGTFRNTLGNLVATQNIDAVGIVWTAGEITGTPANTWDIGATGIQIDGGTIKATTGAFTVAGNWVQNAGTLNPTTSTVVFDGGGAQSIKSSGAEFYSVTISNNSTVSLADAFAFDTGTLTIDVGAVFATAGSDFDHNARPITNNGTFEIEGDETFTSLNLNAGGFTPGLTKIVSNGGLTVLSPTIDGLKDVQFNSGGQIIELGEHTAYITGNIEVVAPTIVKMKEFNLTLANRRTLTNNGTWSALTPSTFTCAGNATFAGGDMSFFNFTAISTDTDTLIFESTKTYTVANTLTLTGADENELFLNTSGATKAYINNVGQSEAVNFVRVLRVDGTVANSIDADDSWDVDNTLPNRLLYWNFGPMLYTFVNTGNWSDAINWEQNMLPRVTDHILVQAAKTLTLDGDQTIVDVTINGTINVNTRDFKINGDFATGSAGEITTSTGEVHVDGVINVHATGKTTFTHDEGVLIADSTVTNLGVLTPTFGKVKYNAPEAGQLIVEDIYKHLQVSDVSAIKTLSGAVTVNGDLTIDTGVTTAMGDHDLTVTGTTTIPGIVTINNATLDANNSFDASGGTITFTGAGDLQLGGTVASLGPNLTDNAGTVTYDFAGGQTIVEDAYYNLIAPETGSGTKTLGGKVTVNGALTIATGNTLALGADTLDVTAGATAIAGGLTIGANGVLDADGTFTAVGGTIALTGTGSMELGGAVADLGTLNSAAGIVNYDGVAAQNILADTYYSLTASGAGPKTLAGRVVLVGDLLIAGPNTTALNGNTLEVGGAADIDGTLTVAADSLIIAGASDFDGILNITTGIIDTEGGFNAENGVITFTGDGKLQLAGVVAHLGAISINNGKVIYDGGNQDIFADTYYDLTAGGTATKELAGAVVVERDLNIEAGVTLDVTGTDYALSIKRTFTNAGTFTARDGTVTFNGTDHQDFTSNASTFNNLAFAGAAGKTLTIRDDLDINGNLTITSGAFSILGAINVTLAGDLTIDTGAFWTKGDGTLTFDGTTQALSDGNVTPQKSG